MSAWNAVLALKIWKSYTYIRNHGKNDCNTGIYAYASNRVYFELALLCRVQQYNKLLVNLVDINVEHNVFIFSKLSLWLKEVCVFTWTNSWCKHNHIYLGSLQMFYWYIQTAQTNLHTISGQTIYSHKYVNVNACVRFEICHL